MDGIEILKLTLQILSTIGAGGIVGGIVSRKLSKSAEQKEIREQEQELDKKHSEELILNLCEANKVLLRAEIYRIGRDVEKNEYFSLREKADFDEAFEAYAKLGGNHLTEKYYNFVCDNYEIKNDE